MGTRSTLNVCVLILDPKKHEIARTCQSVWAQGLKDLAEQLNQYFPNDEEREEFGEGVKNEIMNSNYHLYCMLYKYIRTLVIVRYLVIGRKPDLEV